MEDCSEVQLLNKLHDFLNEFEIEGRQDIWSRDAFEKAYRYDPSVEWSDKKCTMRAIRFVKTLAICCHDADWSGVDEDVVSLLGVQRSYFGWLVGDVPRFVDGGDLNFSLRECVWEIAKLRVVGAEIYGKLVKLPLGVSLHGFAQSAQEYVMDVPQQPIGWGRSPHDYSSVKANYSLTLKHLELFTCLLSNHKNKLQPSAGALILSILRLAHACDVCSTDTAQEEETIFRSSSDMPLKLSSSTQYILAHKINLINLKPSVSSIREITQTATEGEASSLLIQFLERQSEYMKNQEILILKLIEYFLKESLCDSSRVSEDMIIQSSLKNFEIFKAEALFMIFGHNASNCESHADHSIGMAHKRSFVSFTELLSSTLQCEALYSGDRTEAVSNQLSWRIDLNFEDVTQVYGEQGSSSSFHELFKESGRVMFVDHLLGRLRKFLHNQPRAFNLFKDQIGALLQELELVGSFPIHVMEKDIGLKVIRLIHEVEYVLDMFLLGDAPLWYQQLLIFNAVREMRQFKAQINHESFEPSLQFDDKAKIIVDMLQNGSNHIKMFPNFMNEFLDEGVKHWRNFVDKNPSAHWTDKKSTLRATNFLKTIQLVDGMDWSACGMDEDKNLEVLSERRNNYLRWLDREILECDDPHHQASEYFTTIGILRIKFSEICNQLMKAPHPALYLDAVVLDEVFESVQEYVMNLPSTPIGWGHSPRDYGAVEANYRDTVGNLEYFRHLVCNISKQCIDQKRLQSLLTHAAALAFSVLHMAHRNDVHETNTGEMEENIFNCSLDMSHKLSLQHQDSAKFYLDVLLAKVEIIKALKKSSLPLDPRGSGPFLNLLQSAQNHAHILGEILQFPRMDMMTDEPNDHNEHVEILLKQGYVVVANELASLFSSIPSNHGVLSNLLHKLNLMKGEIFVLEVDYLKATFDAFGDNRAATVREAFKFLNPFFKTPALHMGDEEKFILQLIQSLLREAGSLWELSDDMIMESSLAILKLYKVEALFMVLRHSNIKFLAQFRTATVHKILSAFKELISGTPSDSLKDANKLVSVCSLGNSYEEMNQLYSSRDIELNFKEIEGVYIRDLRSLFDNLPRSGGAYFAEHILRKLRKFATRLPDSISSMKDQFETLLTLVQFFISIPSDSKNKGLELRVTFFLYAVEYIFERFIHGVGPLHYHQLVLFIATEEAELLKAEILDICLIEEGLEFSLQNVQPAFRQASSGDRNLETEGLVSSLDDQAKKIMRQLQNTYKKLQVVSLVGMAGIGKTTLAKKVYSSLPIRNHFAVCAMSSVSQVYQKRELLLDILGDFTEVTDDMKKKDDNDLALILKRKLIGRRYLLVIDDVWRIEHWNDLRQSFPDDNMGSRILITTRLHDVALKADPKMEPNIVPLLSHEQSWDLLQAKVFDGESCPVQLMGVGSLIAKNCKGLPLAIVVVGGILKRTEKKRDQWEAIAEHLRSLIADDQERHFTDILEFSYNHLPFYLKPCYLYLGSFLEDQEIPVKKLQWLWMGEGFIPTVDSKSLQETAEGYLKELINRSLVMEAKRSSLGGTKTCRIHDMLRDLCLKKSKEEKFMQLVSLDNLNSSDDSSTGNQYRLCVHSPKQTFIQLRPSTSNVHTLLFFSTNSNQENRSYDTSPIFKYYKLLRVLDLEPITASIYPSGIDLLLCLNYLAIKGNMKALPSSISKLWSLETLVVKGTRGEIALPGTLWSMETLRHVHVRPRASITLSGPEIEKSLVMPNLSSFSCPAISIWNQTDIPKMWIGLKNLRCILTELSKWDSSAYGFPRMEFLTQLESLNVSYIGKTLPFELGFPQNIKKLTLSRFCFAWDYMSVIIQLSKLEVLKLLIRAFEGDTWDMPEDCIFPNLKYLKLENLSIENWEINSLDCKEHFPELQTLVLRGCKKLKVVPSGFGEVPTLQMIEMQLCSQSAMDSTQIILEQQHDELENQDFKISTTEWI